jgi:hypothetical protein
MTQGMNAYANAYELSPITLIGGVAQQMYGGVLPLLSIIQALDYNQGITGGSSVTSDNAFAHFYPLQGTNIIFNQIGSYPFANMSIAANAILAQPLNIALLMTCPVNANTPYSVRQSIFQSIQSTVKQHNQLGGTYNVATPCFYFDNTIMIALTDVSDSQSLQPQIKWRWDFQRPLVTLEEAAQIQSSFMSKISSLTQTDGSPSGIASTVGQQPTLGGTAISPAVRGTPSAGVVGPMGPQIPGNLATGL